MIVSTSDVFRPWPMWGRIKGHLRVYGYFAWFNWVVMWG